MTGVQRNTIQLTQVVFTYTSVPDLKFVKEAEPIAAVVLPNTKESIIFNLLATNARKKLLDAFEPTDGGGSSVDGGILDLKVEVEFQGDINSGGSITSVPITYPIPVFDSQFSGCRGGDFVSRNGGCGAFGGQDGIPLCCLSADGGTPVQNPCN